TLVLLSTHIHDDGGWRGCWAREMLGRLRPPAELRVHSCRRRPRDLATGCRADRVRPGSHGLDGRVLPGARGVAAGSGRGDEAVRARDVSVVLHLFSRSARLQKKRATLTIASIAGGTVTILLLLAFGEGLKRQLSTNEKAMGENLAIHWPGATSRVWKGLPEGRPIRPRIDDIEALRERIPEADVWGEMRTGRTNLTYGRK